MNYKCKIRKKIFEDKKTYYLKEDTDKQFGLFQDRIDFLTGQNTRLKRIENEMERWKRVLKGHSRYYIKQVLEKFASYTSDEKEKKQ